MNTKELFMAIGGMQALIMMRLENPEERKEFLEQLKLIEESAKQLTD